MTFLIKKDLQRLFYKVLLVCGIILILDVSLGNLISHLFFRQTSGAMYRTTYAMDSTKADVLVFGSSRANHHYVPDVFMSQLGLTFYNTGRDGNFLLFNYAVFKTILLRYSPKMVIFDLNPDDLKKSTNSYERLSSLMPYFEHHPELKKIADLKGNFEFLKSYSRTCRFNSSLLTIIIGNLNRNKERKKDYSGYVPLSNSKTRQPLIKNSIRLHPYSPDYNKLIALQSICDDCKKRGIKLILVASPAYYTISGVNNELFAGLASKFQVPFLNYVSKEPFANSPDLFYDADHLNNSGAIRFSSMLTNDIKRLLNKQIQ